MTMILTRLGHGGRTTNPGVRAAIVVLAAAAATAVAGCEPMSNVRLDFTATEKVAVTAIEIDGGSGDVTIHGDGPAGQVRIDRIVRYRGAEPARTYQISGTTLRISTECGRHCSVSYDIQAPLGVTVRGKNGSGDLGLSAVAAVDVRVGSGSISVRDGSADVTVETGSGDVTVNTVAGALVASAGSGSVDARGLVGGSTRIDTGSGDVTVVLAKPGDVNASTGSGNVTLTVPAGSYQVRATTESGESDIRVPDSPAGEHLLELRSGSGEISAATA